MRRTYLVLYCSLGLLVLAYAGASVYLFVEQRTLIFQPRRELIHTPGDFGLRFETVWLPSRDDALLNGWWVPNTDPAAPALLYLHGNDGNIGANAEHAARLNALGFSVFVFDYRGYGVSGGGLPSETTAYEDAEAAWNYLVKTLHAKAENTFIYGHSLGGAIAIDLAVNHPEAAGLIVESTFTSMRDMAESRYAYFPVDWLLNQRFDSLAKIGRVRTPVLFIHGKADPLIPYAMTERLYRAAASPKKLVIIPDAGHDNSATVGKAEYADAVREFVAGAKARRSTGSVLPQFVQP
jgi:fermentation-respiration switch protein FrsA (DUF1100 family)